MEGELKLVVEFPDHQLVILSGFSSLVKDAEDSSLSHS
jgi:hypothetical protein